MSEPSEDSGNHQPDQPIKATVVDIEMRFGSMVLFMVKWVLASIPALLILGALALGAFALVGVAGTAVSGLVDLLSAPKGAAKTAAVVPTTAKTPPVAQQPPVAERTVRVDKQTHIAHRRACPLMKGRIGYYISVAEAQSERYRSCERCDPYADAAHQYDRE